MQIGKDDQQIKQTSNQNNSKTTEVKRFKLPEVKIDWEKYFQEQFTCKTDAIYAPKPLSTETKIREITPVKNIDQIISDCQVKCTKNFNVKKNLFHGSAKDLNKCLQGTPLEGKGQIFLDAQEKFGVNALFLMSIAKVESNYGEAPARDKFGIHKFNISGLKKRGGGYQNNPTYENCVDSCASSMKRLYFNKRPKALETIEQIKTQYCPGNPKWVNKIVQEMNNLQQQILSSYA